MPLREVAIKVANRPMDSIEARQIFRDALAMVEITEAAKDPLMRQHFILVYDAGHCPEGGPLTGHPFVVMELVQGGSIRKCLRKEGPFPWKRACDYFGQMLKALAFMHAGITGPDGKPRPIIHRDIKPDNILVVRNVRGDDIIKMTDFGLAEEVDTLLGWTDSAGDLAYLPPESFSHGICSPQSDIYMLALVFYEMITGHSPFADVGSHLRDEKCDKAQKHEELRKLHLEARRHEKFDRLEDSPEIRHHPELARLIRLALAADMNERSFRDARDFRDAWEGGTPPPPPPPAWEIVRRLTEESEQCFASGEDERGTELLDKAMTLNGDTAQVPDAMLVGKTYLLMVKRLLCGGQQDNAMKVAATGYGRRKCRSTCESMFLAIREANAKLANQYRNEAAKQTDEE
jgi:serine/threonine protein kinase